MSQLATVLGVPPPFGAEDPIETGEGPDGITYVLLRNEIVGVMGPPTPFLTPRGLLAVKPTKRFVTVDMGAVRFVTNGADVMGPGITDVDPDVRSGDWVWVREERHGKPLAAGLALSDAPTLKAKSKGKQVQTKFWVGDKAWTYGHEEPVAAAAGDPSEPAED